MLLLPKKPKFLKSYSNRTIISKSAKKNNIIKFSNLALIATESGFIPNFQIEAIKLFIRRIIKKKAQLFFRIFPDQPITKKPNEVRLGRGKGNLKYWSFYTRQGKIIIEINGQNTKLIAKALKLIKYKLTIKTHIFNTQIR
jgi:large subunit ribosomal protein L16